MARRLVECRLCKQKINRDLDDPSSWIMPSKNYYYHTKCYNDWKNNIADVNSTATDEAWFEGLWNYLAKDLKIEIDWSKTKSQWKNFLKQKMTAKGIYFTIRYFYEYGGGDPKKSKNGIGIVPSVYQQSCEFWANKERREKGICARIEQQIMEMRSQNVITVHQKQKKEKQPVYTFSMVDEEDDE